MNTSTNMLLGAIAAMIFIHWWPDLAYAVFVFLLLGGLGYWVIKYTVKRRKEKAIAAQEAADAPLFEEFMRLHKAVRQKYDPQHEWNEATLVPQEYQDEMDALNAKYKDVLVRRFGDSILDD